ncbi:hypothetical protein ND861_03590 [Leptospira sp. 2 VSF19]|uniref:Uncharacterized protein n=1 Tax=Leptospira soteropolitanensis TaxID=2950025 RepID=A0AAW5V8N1_9LEPT|nr:hypothetical protein [Leptospira soteropolitanensis]MCW7491729.1 hypothetical protein [Leptospira soteropolitanensis]MCW7499314.1 hypothetical protein [Leptospira soteropolitanensis]MCW7521095.1 hypothetical protein [Leptospira soteropolitanensis]MCW7525417.1 hypothetical protein [Leptospira soteropolitanensis]MCW7529284.1 hypothetical protein [Leptospira soteropolitanensis]
MKFFFIFLILLFNCQVSWYHTRVSKNEAKEMPISEAESVLADSGTACFISSIKFQEQELSNESSTKLNSMIDTQFIENIRTNLNLKNSNTKHIKHIYGVPKSWPYLKELKSIRSDKTFERFKQIQNLPIDTHYKKTLIKYAEIADADTYFVTNEDILLSFLEFENCDTYYQLHYTKKEKDNYNVVLFLITLGILPTANYENHYFTVYKRNAFELKPTSITYKFGYRRVLTWLLLPTFNFFNEVENYNKDYRFVDHAKDQFLSAIENKYSQPLPIKHLNPVYGDIIGNMYSSGSDFFKTQIPVDTRYAVIRDGKQNVSFYDPIRGLYKIQVINVNSKINSDIITEGLEKTLKTFITTSLLDKVKKNYPKSAILHEMYTPEYRDGTYTFTLEIAKPEPGNDQFKKEYFVFSCFKSQSQIFLLSRSFPNDTNLGNLSKLSESNILDFYSQITFQSKYIEPKPLDLDIAMNDGKKKSENDTDEDNNNNNNDEEDDEEEENEEELAGGGSVGGESGQIDLGGLFSILKERTHIPRSKLDIKPGRFKFNNARFNPPKMNSSKFHIKPGRTKNFSKPSKWRR